MVDIRSDKRWTGNINARLLADARQTPGSTHRLTLECFDARPELESRAADPPWGAPTLPLLYDVDAAK